MPGNAETGGDQSPDNVSAHLKAQILAEALPHMQHYDEQTVVIKFGGHAMGDEALATAFAQDVVREVGELSQSLARALNP